MECWLSVRKQEARGVHKRLDALKVHEGAMNYILMAMFVKNVNQIHRMAKEAKIIALGTNSVLKMLLVQNLFNFDVF